jgi:hypothetical protein
VKAASISAHLRPYSIFQKRSTTIAHAFASAIAPAEELVATRLAEAIRLLGQEPAADLSCVYCDRQAETWDHLLALVHGGEMSGYGHTLGNLVPACRDCNSRRGNREWRSWLTARRQDGAERAKAIDGYVAFCGKALRSTEDLKRVAPDEMDRYGAVRIRVLELLKEADKIASEIRLIAAAAGASANSPTETHK